IWEQFMGKEEIRRWREDEHFEKIFFVLIMRKRKMEMSHHQLYFTGNLSLNLDSIQDYDDENPCM
ncbi:4887_t:CDS:2, partial [Scutellospora calospora]